MGFREHLSMIYAIFMRLLCYITIHRSRHFVLHDPDKAAPYHEKNGMYILLYAEHEDI